LADGLHPFEDQAYGFGLGFDVRTSVARSQIMGSVGSFGWGGAANTNFWVDPQEELIGLLMLQFMPSGHYPVTPDFRVLTYQAIID
jgi:CubicO group peptidase (beta-lactamase class C family)